MIIQLLHNVKTGMLRVKPRNYRERLPEMRKLATKDGVTYLMPKDRSLQPLPLGTIDPNVWELVSSGKMEIVFKEIK